MKAEPTFVAEPATETWACASCGRFIRPPDPVHVGHSRALCESCAGDAVAYERELRELAAVLPPTQQEVVADKELAHVRRAVRDRMAAERAGTCECWFCRRS
jgi:hypothetical protein